MFLQGVEHPNEIEHIFHAFKVCDQSPLIQEMTLQQTTQIYVSAQDEPRFMLVTC
jgi:hypothetical protein